MRLAALLIAASVALTSTTALKARTIVEASAAQDLSVTIYRDPSRDADQEMERDFPEGFAMITETRTVTLPAGESTIRFIGVSEGMVGVSAIVTGLPGGTIEKNRNAELLSPAALVNGALGNRVTITRTNPATGAATPESAIVRTRADGGLVLQTGDGFEAVRCAGLPEKLTFNRIPDGLSAKPIYSVDTRSDTGGTYEVTLTYLSWGFDWQANYVGTIGKQRDGEEFEMSLLSWLTLLNDNGQSFDNAKLQIIAGVLNIESDFEDLSDPPVARPLRLTCFPIGSTKTGSPVPEYDRSPGGVPPPPPPPPAPMAAPLSMITVTGTRRAEALVDSASPIMVVTAEEEDLGDLKLFRVPDRVNVSAMGLKQVAFLNKEEVKARYVYEVGCSPYYWIDEMGEPRSAAIKLVTKNDKKKGLGIALPQGAMTLYEPTSRGPQVAAMTSLRDYARGEDIELEIGRSSQVFAQCARIAEDDFDNESRKWTKMRAYLTNANPHDVKIELLLGYPGDYQIRFPRKRVRVKNGNEIVEVTIPANDALELDWKLRSKDRD